MRSNEPFLESPDGAGSVGPWRREPKPGVALMARRICIME